MSAPDVVTLVGRAAQFAPGDGADPFASKASGSPSTTDPFPVMVSSIIPTPTPLHTGIHLHHHNHLTGHGVGRHIGQHGGQLGGHHGGHHGLGLGSSDTLSYMQEVDIGVICFYAPVLAIATYFAIRHGFGRNSGWIYLHLFCLVRMVGAALELATLGEPFNLGLYKGALILANIGLSPLLLSLLGLLSRVVSDIQDDHKIFFRTFHIRVFQTVVAIGMILGIVGGVKAGKGLGKDGDQTFSAGPLLEAAIIMFSVVFMLLGVVQIVLAKPVLKFARKGERFLFIAILMSMGPIVVRLIYSAVGYFSHNKKWQPPILTGTNASTTMYTCMALLMEFLAVVHWEVAGFFLRVIPKEEWKAKKTLFNSKKTRDVEKSGADAQDQPQTKKQQATELAKAAGQYTLAGRLLMWTSSAAAERKKQKREQPVTAEPEPQDASPPQAPDGAGTFQSVSAPSSASSSSESAGGDEDKDKLPELIAARDTPAIAARTVSNPQARRRGQTAELHLCPACERRARCLHRNKCSACGLCAHCQCECD